MLNKRWKRTIRVSIEFYGKLGHEQLIQLEKRIKLTSESYPDDSQEKLRAYEEAIRNFSLPHFSRNAVVEPRSMMNLPRTCVIVLNAVCCLLYEEATRQKQKDKFWRLALTEESFGKILSTLIEDLNAKNLTEFDELMASEDTSSNKVRACSQATVCFRDWAVGARNCLGLLKRAKDSEGNVYLQLKKEASRMKKLLNSMTTNNDKMN